MIDKIFNFLCIVYLIDIFIGGGGTILSINNISLRMILFGVIFIIFIIKLLRVKKILYFYLTFLFFGINLLALYLGILNKADLNYILLDVKPLLSFFMILPLAIFLKQQNIKDITKIIKKVGLIQGVIYLLCFFIMKFKIVPFEIYYNFFSNLGTGEIFFRGTEKFFYKGFLYLNIAFLFYFFQEKKKIVDKIIIMMLGISIYLTDTRGFILALLLCFTFHFWLKWNIKERIVYLLLSIPMVYIVISKLFLKVSIEKKAGDTIRINQIMEVINSTNILSLIMGHGYGIGVKGREIHMEIVYMEIFHKQGILGILFYSILLYKIYWYYSKIKNKESKKEYYMYMMGSFFIYFQSLTNPFLINPIGLTFIILSIVIGGELYNGVEDSDTLLYS